MPPLKNMTAKHLKKLLGKLYWRTPLSAQLHGQHSKESVVKTSEHFDIQWNDLKKSVIGKICRLFALSSDLQTI
jgi:hypothetical protein